MYPSTNNLSNSSFTPPPPPPPSLDSSTNPNFSSFFHPIHSPYLFYEDDLHHIHEHFLHQQQQQQQAHTTNVAHAHDHQEITTVATTTMENHIELEAAAAAVNRGIGGLVKDDALCNNSTTGKQQIPRKRTSKKDRHSKINTAHGPRDRRMRLSLDVAQKFFGLQDILGFDKASKTVHWLLTKSKTAIKQLTNSTRSGGNNNVSNAPSVSSTSNNSECEVLSGIINDDSSLSLPGGEVTTTEKEKVKPAVVAREKRAATSSKVSRGSRAFHPLAKETRERARARARERTVEKRIRLGNGMEGMDQSLNRHLRSWSPFESSGGEESSSQIQIVNNHPSFLRADHQQQASQSGTSLHKQGMNVSGHEQYSLFNAPVSWSASPYSNYHHNAAISSHENQFMEFQCFGKPWDQAYNN